MALVPNRSAVVVRRVAAYSLAVDAALGLLLGLLINGTVGLVIFIVGLVLTGLFYLNYLQVQRTRGNRY